MTDNGGDLGDDDDGGDDEVILMGRACHDLMVDDAEWRG